MLKTKTTAKINPWEITLRSRVGDSTTYQGFQWVNLTGKNGEPGASFDWELIKQPIVEGYEVVIDGRVFDYKPVIGNSGATRTQGDIAMNNWISQNKFGKILEYSGVNGGEGSSLSDWTVIESIG